MPLFACWLGLGLLSLLSLWLVAWPGWAAAALSLLALAKAWLIVDVFMELRLVRGPWRWLLLAWAAVMALALFFAS